MTLTGSRFIHPVPKDHRLKLAGLLPALQVRYHNITAYYIGLCIYIVIIKSVQKEVCCHGAWIENKGALLTYHYRAVPSTIADRRDALVRRAVQLFLEHGCHPHHTQMAIEARPPVPWSLGRASLYILRTTYGVDWPERVRIVYAGDDDADEDAMETLSGLACTFRVSKYPVRNGTAANYRLRDPNSVLSLLRCIEARLNGRLDHRVVMNPSPVFSANFLITCIHSEMDEGKSTESTDDDITTSSSEYKRRRRNSKGSQLLQYQTAIKTAAASTSFKSAFCHQDSQDFTTVIGH